MEERRNWGDLYIGLHLAAQTVQGFTEIAVNTPRFALAGRYSALGSPGIWDDLKGLFSTVAFWIDPWNSLPWVYSMTVLPAIGWLKAHLFDNLKDKLTGLLDGVTAKLGGLGWDLYWRFLGWYQWGQDKIGNLQTWWHDAALPAIERIKASITNLPVHLYNQFLGWHEWGRGKIRDLATWWHNEARPVIDHIRSVIANIPVSLYNQFLGWWEWLKAFSDRAVTKFEGGVTRVLDNITAWMAQRTIESHRSLEVYEKEMAAGRDPRAPDAMQAIINQWSPTVRGWMGNFESIPATFLNWVATTAGTDLAMEPSRALATTGSLYSMSIAAGTTAHVLSTALNAIPGLNWIGAAQLSAYVAEVAAFDVLTQATYGVLINECLAGPMRYHWNQVLRPRIPTEGAIYAMGRKRGLNREQFGKAMSYHGLPEWWIDKEYSFFWADPSPYWLLRMSEHATPQMEPSEPMRRWLAEWLPDWPSDPWAWFKMKLMLGGFEDTDIMPFIEGFQRRRLTSAVTQIKTSVRAMVREGYWDRTEAKAALEPMGVREEEIELLILAEEIDYQNRFLDDQVRYLTEAFRKGEISGQDLSLALSTMIVKPERVAQIVSREQVRALPKPKSVVAPKEDPLVKSLVRQAITSWTKGYRAWELEEEELELGLTIVLQDPALAHQMVLTERTRYRPEPPPPKPPVEDPIIRKSRTAAIASWVNQFRQGQISVDVMELGLANLIADSDTVLLVRQIEELRARPTPGIIPPWEEDPLVAAVRQQAVTGHIEMFRKRLIGIDELYAYLVADGLAEPLARATALTQALKRIKTPPLESPYFTKDHLRELIDEAMASYTRQLELGQISIEEYEIYLAGAGVDPAVVTYLGDTQEVRRFIQAGGMA